MEHGFKIRKADIDDAIGLTECMHSAYSLYTSRMKGNYLPPMNVDYREEILGYPTWVIEDNSKIIAGLILTFEEEAASIGNISVHPDFQGKGIGRLLMDFAEKQAKNSGFSELKLTTHILLTENISLYKHLGWIEVGRDKTKVYLQKHI